MAYIDIHNHLTWHIDDGIQTQDEFEQAILHAKQDGIEAMIATPHFIPGKSNDSIEIMKKRMQEAKSIADTYYMNYYYGCEFLLNDFYLEFLENRWVLPLADSSYVLCEFDVRKNIGEESEVEARLETLFDYGYIPIIAHVERYFRHRIDIKRVESWIEMGCLIQANRTSFLGTHGSIAKKNAQLLLKKGLIHFVASDAHRIQGDRICKLSDMNRMLSKIIGKDNTKLLLYENPLAIIQNKEIQDMMKY